MQDKKEKAIVALLESSSVAEAAAAIGTTPATVHRWIRDDEEFSGRYRTAKQQAMTQAIGRLQTAAGKAVDVLQAIMVDPEQSPTPRVTAARSILEMAFKATELYELEERINQLERIANETQGAH